MDFEFVSFSKLARHIDYFTVSLSKGCDLHAYAKRIAKELSSQVTNGTGFVCDSPVVWFQGSHLRCCGWESSGSTVECKSIDKRNTWLDITDKILILSFACILLYSPLVLIYLPIHFVGSESISKFIEEDLTVNRIHQWIMFKLLQCWPRGDSSKSHTVWFSDYLSFAFICSIYSINYVEK